MVREREQIKQHTRVHRRPAASALVGPGSSHSRPQLPATAESFFPWLCSPAGLPPLSPRLHKHTHSYEDKICVHLHRDIRRLRRVTRLYPELLLNWTSPTTFCKPSTAASGTQQLHTVLQSPCTHASPGSSAGSFAGCSCAEVSRALPLPCSVLFSASE